jgi:hypothetical protein
MWNRRPGLLAPLSLLLLGLTACKSPAKAAAESAERMAALAEARAQASEMDKARTAAIIGARGKIVPHEELGKCPVDISVPSPGGPTSRIALNILFTIQSVAAVDAENLATERGSAFKNFINDVERAERSDSDTPPNTASLLDFRPELVLVIDHKTDAKMGEGKTFDGGVLLGRAYLYDYRQKAIICAATVLAENSDSVQITRSFGDSKDALEGDLIIQALNVAKARLVKAGPVVEATIEPLSSAKPGASAKPIGKRPKEL